MFAYGAGPCAQVDLVTGPGNIYTVSAKRLLKGVVGIDSEAGPTEIAILADDTADPAFVAADLLSQAEHDPMAAAVLVTPSHGAGRRGGGRAGQAGLRHPARRPDPHGAVRRAVRHRAGRRPRAGPGGGGRLRRRAPGDPDPGRGGPGPPGAQRRRHLRGRRSRRSRSATTAPGPTTCCPPGAAPATARGCPCAPFRKALHLIEYDERALREVAPHVVHLAEAEDLPGPRRRGHRPRAGRPDGRSSARGAAGDRAVRRAAARRTRRAQRQREPLRPQRGRSSPTSRRPSPRSPAP